MAIRAVIFVCLCFSLAPEAEAFGPGLPELLHHSTHHVSSLGAPHHASLLTASGGNTNVAQDLFQAYKQSLKEHPLTTKMMTGGTLAICGDALAQTTSANEDEKFVYDKRRAASFGVFDMAYRALQHVAFPFLVLHCQGQYATSVLDTLGLSSILSAPQDVLAALEQTLASQLGIVPFLYYPVFFTLTGFVQGLSSEQALSRAQETFLPLMKRNLLFWIPVQFVQFEYIPTDLQIPFLSVAGLIWTCILSLYAGSTKQYANNSQEQVPIATVQNDQEDEVLELTALQNHVTQVVDERLDQEEAEVPQDTRELVRP